MSEQDLGRIQINDDVIATIGTLAAVEVDGIAGIAGASTLADVWGGKGNKKGISVATDEKKNEASIELEVNVEYGVDVYRAARQLQHAVKNAVETMTGLRVRAVNVRISGIIAKEKPRPPRVHPIEAAQEA